MSGGTVGDVFDAVADVVPELRDGLVDRRQRLDSENPSGETQLAADEWSDGLFADRLTGLDGVGAYASEERQSVLECGEGYAVAIDPLDGSSNLVSNNPVGTIVGVYESSLPAGGDKLVAAGYLVYGTVTTMALAREGTAAIEIIEDGTRRRLESEYRIPGDATVRGLGGSPGDWTPEFSAFAAEIEDELKCRYSGALVADVNQVLRHGGVFAYPALQSRPAGKLRAQFEGAPMAYVIESAGGGSSDGERSLLETPIDGLHERTPVALGTPGYIKRLENRTAREVAQ